MLVLALLRKTNVEPHNPGGTAFIEKSDNYICRPHFLMNPFIYVVIIIMPNCHIVINQDPF